MKTENRMCRLTRLYSVGYANALTMRMYKNTVGQQEVGNFQQYFSCDIEIHIITNCPKQTDYRQIIARFSKQPAGTVVIPVRNFDNFT